MTFSDSAKFRCNICGTVCERPPEGIPREGSSCLVCFSSARVRAVISLLSEELLGVSMPISEFPVMKGIRGIGMSDSPELAERLAGKLDYTNTFYHQAPHLDITNPNPQDFGRYDFILSSEVMEHVPPPIEAAFVNLSRMLKPNGLLVMTTPYGLDGKTNEHFPELYEFTLATLGGQTVMVNRRRDGSIEVFENLMFHGGPGSTVEMRLFTEESLREHLKAAGFSSVRIAAEDVPEFGVGHVGNWSLPIVARKGTFHPPAAEIARAYRETRQLATQLEEQLAILQGDYERFVAHHKTWQEGVNRELAERYEWGKSMETQLTARTEWAQSLDLEIASLQVRLQESWDELDRLKREKDFA